MEIEVVTCDVFTERRFAGNQLAVVAAAGALTAAEMQAIAREMSYSETTFVVGHGARGPKVRIFTPSLEMPFAGHPTLGTAAVLTGFGDGALTLELGVGPVPVTVVRTGYGARAELRAPLARAVEWPTDAVALCRAVGAERAELPVEVWSAGNPFALIEVPSLEALARCHPVSAPSDGLPLGILVFAWAGPRAVRARVFIPGDPLIPEDPATGSANAPLATFLHHHGRLAIGETLVTDQGVEMGRPSRLEARLDGERRASIAGGVVPVMRATMTLDRLSG